MADHDGIIEAGSRYLRSRPHAQMATFSAMSEQRCYFVLGNGHFRSVVGVSHSSRFVGSSAISRDRESQLTRPRSMLLESLVGANGLDLPTIALTTNGQNPPRRLAGATEFLHCKRRRLAPHYYSREDFDGPMMHVGQFSLVSPAA